MTGAQKQGENHIVQKSRGLEMSGGGREKQACDPKMYMKEQKAQGESYSRPASSCHCEGTVSWPHPFQCTDALVC